MKKILFATTALVATAGVAAADVTFGGYARFGLGYDGGNDLPGENDTFITSRYRLQIDATAESDNGVQFGARVRIQQDQDDLANEVVSTWNDDNLNGTVDPGEIGPVQIPGSAPNGFYNNREGTGINGARFFVRAAGLEVGVGNIFGALEFMPGQYPIDLGLTGLGYDYTPYAFSGDAYSSDDNGAAGLNGIELIYSYGDFSVHASASDDNDRRAIVGAYTWTGWTFALGFQDSNAANDTDWSASAGGDIGPVFVSLAFADNGTAGDHWVLAGRFDINAVANIEAYYAYADYADTGINPTGYGSLNVTRDELYGIDFFYDLGGGTSARGGVAREFDGDTVADLGVRFDF